MKVGQLRINGIHNPIGFAYDTLRCSWKVWDTEAIRQEYVCIHVSETENFESLIYMKEGADLNAAAELLEMTCKPCTRYYFRVGVTGDNGETGLSEVGFFETGKMTMPWSGKWIGVSRQEVFHPVFHKNFQLPAQVKKARLYVTGLGLYEVTLNKQKVGNEVLTPLYSDYHQECQYQTYEVTECLQQENDIAISLGNGWYKGRFGLAGHKENFGSIFMTCAELHVELENGEYVVISTDESWQYQGSLIEASDIYDGEIYNTLLWENRENPWRQATVLKDVSLKRVERLSLPVIEKEELSVKEIIHTPSGEVVLDFGQNFTGVINFYSEQPKGTRITMDFGEILQNGNFYNENYRSAKSQYVYISDGTSAQIMPKFTFFGFRYARISGWVGEINSEDFIGKVLYSDMEITGNITTGHEKVNQLFSNAMWGQKSNFLDFPTDCPQRDERLAWTGDAQVFAGTACFNMDTRAFYHKFIHDLRMEQVKFDGIVPGVIPVFDPRGPICCSVWGDIGTFLPSMLYERYGDLNVLQTYYPMMKDWVDYITREDAKRGQKFLFDFGDQIGDWLAQDGRTPQSMKGGTDDYFIASCYYGASVRKVAEMAQILGLIQEADHYKQLFEQIKVAILTHYFTATGRLAVDTQTAYLVALDHHIYKDLDVLKAGLRNRLYRDCYQIKGGFVGAPSMCRVLAENGFEEEAAYFLLNEDYPGWLHCINLGATTIWERWNSVLDNGFMSGTMMNSLNHYAFGAVVEYLYKQIGGLQPLTPGFKSVKIAPQIHAKLKFAEVTYDSVYGTYVVTWEICPDGMLEVSVEVPFNCQAVVQLPYYEVAEIELTSGSHQFRYEPMVPCHYLFTKKTFFKDMMDNEKAVNIIKEKLPLLHFFLEKGDVEFLNENLTTLHNLHFLGFQPEAIEAAASDIMRIV